ncbi:MAG: hypothetical protein IPM42_16010 [Saprospiraceae bacterium]|nr:hypothetical protein [Saprospiraceae bacterium]
MKKIIILTTFLFATSQIFAQLRLGVTGYYSSVNFKEHVRELPTLNGLHAYNFSMASHSNQYSFGIGLFNNYGNLFLNAEALYRINKASYNVQSFMEGERTVRVIDESRNVLFVPVAAGVDLGMFRIGVGPTFEFILDETNHISQNSLLTRKRRNVHCGFQFTGGIDLNNHIMINLKYETEFNKTGDMYYFNGQNTRVQSRISRISVGIGIYI